MAKKITPPKSTRELPQAIIKHMLSLATSGFGLAAALAWNEVIKETIDTLVKPYLPQGSTLISLLLYASIITALAVLITLQLTKLQQKLSHKNS